MLKCGAITQKEQAMKLETLLNAMEKARGLWVIMYNTDLEDKYLRQYRAFRERILRMDAEKNLEIKKLNLINDINLGLYEDIEFDANAKKISIAAYKAIVEQQSKQLAEKDTENQRLRGLLKKCYKAIESLPLDALGTGYISGTGEPYPLRDELLHNIAKELSDGD